MKTTSIKIFTAIIFLALQYIGSCSVRALKHSHNTNCLHNYFVPPLLPKNDSITICENSGTTTVPVEGIDSVADIPPVIYAGPKHGIAVVNGKSINYTPNHNYSGKDTISYIVCDTAFITTCDTAHLYITINPSPTVTTGPPQTM
ncbi:MAG TPA: Ig-like domain-containing protein, partial [Bacteroidia bacterium]|nr:Ig-like domain-containing protein [Bacteroidia bacterium]